MLLDLSSFQKAVGSYRKALETVDSVDAAGILTPDQMETLRAGVIQNFEVTYELCWKFMKRWLENNLGSVYVDGVSRRELFRIAAEHQLLDNVDLWMGFHQARNETSHIYDQGKARAVFNVARQFLAEARDLLVRLEKKNDGIDR